MVHDEDFAVLGVMEMDSGLDNIDGFLDLDGTIYLGRVDTRGT